MAGSEHLGTALITGASSGIGAVYADRLARRGHDLILVARNPDRLQHVADRLASSTGRAIETLAADLNDKADLARVEARLRDDASITMLVNNAGVGATGPLLASDVDKMEAMIALNVGALTRLTYAAAPGFVARGGGTIVNIASIVALAPEQLNGVYGASKAYVLAFSQSLHHELADKGVRIQAVLPGATATEFWASAGLPVENLPQGDRHDRRRHGRRGPGRARSGRAGDHPVTAGRSRLGRLRSGPPGARPEPVAGSTGQALHGPPAGPGLAADASGYAG